MPEPARSCSSTTRPRCARPSPNGSALPASRRRPRQGNVGPQHLEHRFSGILVTDLKMEGMTGMELLRQSQQIDPELPVIVITGHGDVRDRGRGDAARRLRLHREAVRARALSRGGAASQREAPAGGREPPAAARRQRADAEHPHDRHVDGGRSGCAPRSPSWPAPMSASSFMARPGSARIS